MADVTHTGYLDNDYLEDDYLEGSICNLLGMQVGLIGDAVPNVGMQAGEITVDATNGFCMSVNYVEQAHREHGEYLVDDYLGYDDDYLAEKRCVFVCMQVKQEVPKRVCMQVEQVLYNTCGMRILCEFASRGTEDLGGENWTATNQAAGDFSPNNLNTDIVEQVYRSTTTVVDLVADTGVVQGVGIDTLAFINHNLTDGALVQLQGSNDNFASAPNFTTNLQVTPENLYYIAESLPGVAETNRYWKLIIQDISNPDGYIQIGTVLFGQSQIFSKAGNLGCPSEPIIHGKRHFKDEVPTEGFTNVMNDRSIKKFLRLRFEKFLVEGTGISGTNFGILNSYICEAKTDLKCLIIPTPGCPIKGVDTPDPVKANRFGVFAKLTRLPEISYISADCDTVYATLALEWDESL